MSDDSVDTRVDDEAAPTWGEPVPPAGTPPATSPVPIVSSGAVRIPRSRPGLPPGARVRPSGRPEPLMRERAPGVRPLSSALPREPVETIRVGRRERRRVRIVERFVGRRVRPRTSWFRRARSIVFLIMMGAIMAAVVAAIFAAVVAGLALAIHHLSQGGT